MFLKRGGRVDAAAALEEHQVVDREPVAKMRDGLADEVRDLVHRRAGLLLFGREVDEQALANGRAE